MSRFAHALASRAEELGIEIPTDLVAPLEVYFALLARWNRTINLTSLPVEELADEAIDRLLLEPIAAGPLFPTGRCSWVDLGSGGGSPAIPLKLLRPEASLTMVESRSRKIAFLREAIRELRLPEARAEAERFDNLIGHSQWIGSADVVSARAVRPTQEFVLLVEQLLHTDGELLIFETAGTHRIESIGLTFVAWRRLLEGQSAHLSVYKRSA